MPGQNGPHQRIKLSTSMYKKLKIFIMSKRRRMRQEKEIDAKIDKRKKAREERRRMKEAEKSNLQNTVEQIEALTKRLEELRKQKQEAFSRFRTIVYEEQKMKDIKEKEEADALLNVNIQFGSGPTSAVAAGATLGHPSTGAPHPHTLYMQAQPPTHVLHSRTTPLYVPPPAAHQQPTVAKAAAQSTTQTTPHNAAPSSGPSLSLIPTKRRRSPSPPSANPAVSFKTVPGPPGGSSFSTGHGAAPPVVPAQQGQQSGPAAAQATAAKVGRRAGVESQRAVKNALFVENPLNYHHMQAALYRGVPAGPASRVLSSATSSPVTNANYGKTLPPAPTSYRGSITTGQSAQQIQLQAAAAYQFHQAAVQQQQQQQQHIPKTSVSAAAAAAAAAAAGYPARAGAPQAPGFPPTTQPFSAYSFPTSRRYPY